MKCTECGSAMTKTTGDHNFLESGLDNVIIRNATKYECSKCGAKRVNILALAQLNKAIALALTNKPARLRSIEVRYLREYLQLSNKEFAEIMGVSPEQASRWTTTEQLGAPAERLLRVLATLGPEAIAARSATAGEMKAIDIDPTEMLTMLKHLGLISSEPERTPIHVRRDGSGWKSETVPSA